MGSYYRTSTADKAEKKRQYDSTTLESLYQKNKEYLLNASPAQLEQRVQGLAEGGRELSIRANYKTGRDSTSGRIENNEKALIRLQNEVMPDAIAAKQSFDKKDARSGRQAKAIQSMADLQYMSERNNGQLNPTQMKEAQSLGLLPRANLNVFDKQAQPGVSNERASLRKRVRNGY